MFIVADLVSLRKNYRFVKTKLCVSLKILDSHIDFLELNSHNIMNVDFRVKQLRLSHVHEIFNGTGPSYLSHKLIKVSDVHHHFT